MTPIPAGRVVLGADVLTWPRVEMIGPRRLVLLEDHVIEWQAYDLPRQRYTTPAGTEVDGASVPAVLEWYIGRDNLLPAAVPHDDQYSFRGRLPAGRHEFLRVDGRWVTAGHVWTRAESDRFFARSLAFCPDLRADQRRWAYRAVRVGGWNAWRRGQPAWGGD